MRRSVVPVLLLIVFLLLLALGPIGCGGGSAVGPAHTVTVAPSPLSMNLGQVQQVAASVTDANNNAVGTETITFTSSDTTIASVSPAGLVCAGTWDSTFVHCNPGKVGTATVTAKASPSGITSNGVPVHVHFKADSIVVGESFPVAVPLSCGVPVAVAPGCISSGAIVPNNTERFTALACSNDPVVCAPAAAPCPLDPNTLGPFTFGGTNPSVATVAQDVTNPNFVAVVTAVGPGQTQITASLSATTSLPAPFAACSPASIQIHVPNQPTTTTVSIAPTGTAPLAADILDTNGIPVPNIALTWSSSLPAAATVNAGGTITGVAAGTSKIVASCTPPGCNSGTQNSLFSNVVQANVSGTFNSTTLFVTSTDPGTTTIIPVLVSSTSNSVGAAINLPGGFLPPNSFVFAPDGKRAYLGSDSGLIILDAVNSVTTGVTAAPGKVLAVSNDGARVVIAASNGNGVLQYDTVNGIVGPLSIAGATSADYTPDRSLLFVGTSASRVYEAGINIFKNFAASGAPAGMALLASGAFAYAGDASTDVFSTCSNSLVGNVGIASTLIKAAAQPVPPPNEFNLQMIAVTGNQITQIDAVPGAPGVPCPAIPTNTAHAYSFPGVAAFTAGQLLVTPNSARAVVTASDVNQLLVYNIGPTAGSGSTTTIPLTNGATGTYSGAVTIDSTIVWVGAVGVNQVQAYNLTNNTAVTSLSVPLTPKLLGMRYQ